MVCLAVWGVCTVGCAGTDALSRELSLLRREVREVRKDLVQARRQVERLESRVTLLSLGADGMERTPSTPVAAVQADRRAVSGAPSDRSARDRRPGRVLPVVRLGQRAPASAASPGEPYEEGALDDGSPPVLIKVGPSEDAYERLPVDHEVLRRPDPVLDPTGSARRPAHAQYERALATFREAGRPEAALAQFERFLRAHPRSRFADNAAYWSGECLYSLGRFDEAVQTFEKMVADYPKSAKVPHAMLRTAEVHMARGRETKGRRLLRAVVRAHPTSEAAERARARLKAKGR